MPPIIFSGAIMEKLKRHGKRWSASEDIELVSGMYELRNTRRAKHVLSERLQRTVGSVTDRLVRLGFATVMLQRGGFPVLKKANTIYIRAHKNPVRAANAHLKLTMLLLGYAPYNDKAFEIPEYVRRYIET